MDSTQDPPSPLVDICGYLENPPSPPRHPHGLWMFPYPIHHYLDTTTGEHKQKKAGENDLGVEFVGKKTLAFGCNII